MKTLLRTFLACLLALWVIQNFISGFKISDGGQTLLLGAAALTFIYIFVKPFLKLFFLPINFLSLGLLSWVVNVVVLYLLTIVIPKITITAWQFTGFSYQGFAIPPYSFSQMATFILVSLVLSLIVNFLIWLGR